MPGEERQRRDEAVGDEEDGGEGVDANVHVSDSLEELEAGGSEDSVVSGKKYFNGASGPPENLVQPVSQVDWRGSAEGVAFGEAIDGAPASVVHPVSGHHVLRDGAVDPADAGAPLRLVLVPEGVRVLKDLGLC